MRFLDTSGEYEGLAAEASGNQAPLDTRTSCVRGDYVSQEYEIIERLPSVEEYRGLCTAVGWESEMNFEAAHAALAHSLYGVVVTIGEQVVGMGRFVGDRAIFFYIQDIAVDPGHQQRGLGTKIVDALMQHLSEAAPEKAFVGLFAAKGSSPFYERYGFRDWSPGMTGMFLVMN